MSTAWELQRPSGQCSVTGRTLQEGEEFYSALFEEGETFRRADYAAEAWPGPPEGCYCHFKSRVPVRKKPRQLLVDNEALVAFFLRLAEEKEPIRVQFRFVLALILMRKRILRYDGSRVADGVEVWRMTLPRDGTVHEVVNPQLTEDQIGEVSHHLGAILHSDMGAFAQADEAATTEPDAES